MIAEVTAPSPINDELKSRVDPLQAEVALLRLPASESCFLRIDDWAIFDYRMVFSTGILLF
jgi:hypothetical protein